MSSTSHTVKIRGYFRGLSWPSGTERIMVFFTAPVSNSAGHTRFPTFSSTTRSRSSVPISRRPCSVIPASRWHIPPVCNWIDRTPAPAIAAASTSESMSASITPIRSSSFSVSMVRSSVVVLPLPGEDIRFSRNVPFCFSACRTRAASRSLSANTLSFTSMIL